MVIDPDDGVIEQPHAATAIPVATASPVMMIDDASPVMIDDAWSCGSIVCAIFSCVCIVIAFPIWLIVFFQTRPGFDDAVNAQNEAF